MGKSRMGYIKNSGRKEVKYEVNFIVFKKV